MDWSENLDFAHGFEQTTIYVQIDRGVARVIQGQANGAPGNGERLDDPGEAEQQDDEDDSRDGHED